MSWSLQREVDLAYCRLPLGRCLLSLNRMGHVQACRFRKFQLICVSTFLDHEIQPFDGPDVALRLLLPWQH